MVGGRALNKDKIFYISPRDILKGRVDPIMMMQTCNSLAKVGYDVVLVSPLFFRAENIRLKQIWDYYGLKENSFKLVILPTLLWDDLPIIVMRVFKFFWHFLYAWWVLFEACFRRSGSVVIISRCLVSTVPYLFILSPIRKLKKVQFVYELHAFNNDRSHRLILENMDAIFCISDALRRKICDTFSIQFENTAIARMGVNLENYNTNKDKMTLRKELSLPLGSKIAMYTGKVYAGSEEIQMILEAAKQLPQICFVIAGGKSVAVEYWQNYCNQEGINNILFVGFISPAIIPDYQLAADVLLMYYPSNIPTADVASPGKMMEYMATGNPIISVDFPVFCEVLHHEENAITIPPDSSSTLVEVLLRILNNFEWANLLGKQAQKDVIAYSWDNRAKLIQSVCQSYSRKGDEKKN